MIETYGTVITVPGTYTLVSSMEFVPTVQTPAELLGVDGTFETGVLIQGTSGVTLDLSGFTLALNADQAWLQRHFTTITINNCNNVVITGGAVGRSSSNCIQVINSTNVTVEYTTLMNFELCGLLIQSTVGVNLTNVVCAGSFAGRRPSAPESMMISYLPLLESTFSTNTVMQYWTTIIEGFANPARLDAPAISDQFGVFAVFVSNSSNVVVDGLNVTGPLRWTTDPHVYRSVNAQGVPSTFFEIDTLVPTQGIYKDLCPAIADLFLNFLNALSGQLALLSEPTPKTFLVYPIAKCPHPCLAYADGFVQNCSSCNEQIQLLNGSAALVPGSTMGRVRLVGLDLYGRRVTGLVALWIEYSTNVSVSNLSVFLLEALDPLPQERVIPCFRGGLFGCKDEPEECFTGSKNETVFFGPSNYVQYYCTNVSGDAATVVIPEPCNEISVLEQFAAAGISLSTGRISTKWSAGFLYNYPGVVPVGTKYGSISTFEPQDLGLGDTSFCAPTSF
jgi:hypothetical protein